MNRSDDDVELRELVRKHRVIWETRPEAAVRDERLTPIGFVVELTATHDHPRHPASAGCEECVPVRQALARLASAVVPRGPHASWYDIAVSANALRFDRAHGNRAEVSATITILHNGRVNEPPDECERACLDEICGRLVALGAQERRWVEPSP